MVPRRNWPINPFPVQNDGYYTVIPQISSALNRHRTLFALVVIALVLRAAFVLLVDPHPDFSGGDASWYMQNGRALMSTGTTPGPLQTAPLYPVFVGTVQVLFPGWHTGEGNYSYTEMQVIRVLQAALGAALCAFIFLLGRRLISARAGSIAGWLAALSPALIIEAGNITTEGLFLFLMFGALALYVRARADATPRQMALVGAVLGLATLTRAVLLLFPLGIAVHLLLTRRERWLRLSAALLITYSAVVATWTVYNLAVWDRLVIGGDGLLSFVHQGAAGKAGPAEYDAELGLGPRDTHTDRMNRIKSDIKETILGDPIGWVEYRIKELGRWYLQPHNTNHYPGESIRHAVQDWLLHDRSLDGLLDLTRIEAFWEKLALYIFHFGALATGAIGMLLFRDRWRTLLPLYGVILYFTGVHLVLLALPRYLFPTYPAFGIFGAGVIASLWSRLSPPQRTSLAVHSSVSGDTPLVSRDSTS